jgi:hypothetical protein
MMAKESFSKLVEKRAAEEAAEKAAQEAEKTEIEEERKRQQKECLARQLRRFKSQAGKVVKTATSQIVEVKDKAVQTAFTAANLINVMRQNAEEQEAGYAQARRIAREEAQRLEAEHAEAHRVRQEQSRLQADRQQQEAQDLARINEANSQKQMLLMQQMYDLVAEQQVRFLSNVLPSLNPAVSQNRAVFQKKLSCRQRLMQLPLLTRYFFFFKGCSIPGNGRV